MTKLTISEYQFVAHRGPIGNLVTWTDLAKMSKS